jgi:hypothetical protein
MAEALDYRSGKAQPIRSKSRSARVCGWISLLFTCLAGAALIGLSQPNHQGGHVSPVPIGGNDLLRGVVVLIAVLIGISVGFGCGIASVAVAGSGDRHGVLLGAIAVSCNLLIVILLTHALHII